MANEGSLLIINKGITERNRTNLSTRNNPIIRPTPHPTEPSGTWVTNDPNFKPSNPEDVVVKVKTEDMNKKLRSMTNVQSKVEADTMSQSEMDKAAKQFQENVKNIDAIQEKLGIGKPKYDGGGDVTIQDVTPAIDTRTPEEIKKDNLPYVTPTKKVGVNVTDEVTTVEEPAFSKVVYSKRADYSPLDKSILVVYTDENGALTGKTSDSRIDFSQYAGQYIDKKAFSKQIQDNPFTTQIATTTKTYTVPEESKLTKTPVPFDYLGETASVALQGGTQIYNPKTNLYEPQILRVKPIKNTQSFPDFVVSSLESAPKTLFYDVPFNISKNVLGEGTQTVTVKDQRFLRGGTAAYNPATNEFYVPAPQDTPLVPVTYQIEAPTSSFIAGETFLLGNALMFASQPVRLGTIAIGEYNILRGAQKRNRAQQLKGVAQSLPLALSELGSIGYQYANEQTYGKPIKLSPVDSTKTRYIDEQGNQVFTKTGLDRINPTNDEGNVIFGQAGFKDGKMVLAVKSEGELQSYLIPVNTRLRDFFGLQPKGYELFQTYSSTDATLARAMLGKDITLATGTTKFSPTTENTQLLDNGVGTPAPTGQSMMTTKSIIGKYNPNEFSYEDTSSIVNRAMFSQMQSKNPLVTITSPDSSPEFYRYFTKSTISNLPTDYGLMEITNVPYNSIGGGIRVIDAGSILYRVRGVATSTEGDTIFSNLLIEAAPSPEGTFISFGRSGAKTMFTSKETVAKLVSLIPSKTSAVSLPVVSPRPTLSSYELAPTIVGGLGQSSSAFAGKGSVASNVDENQGKLSLAGTQSTKTEQIVKPLEINANQFKIVTKSIEDTTTKTETKQGQGSKSKQTQETTTDTLTDTITQTKMDNLMEIKLKSELQQSTKQKFAFSSPVTPRIPIPSFKIGAKPSKPTLLDKVKTAYNVVVFKAGREQVIAKGLPKGLATKAGVQNVLTTLRASFKLKPAGTTAQEDIFYKLPAGFRLSKTDNQRFVQLKNLRFGSRPETREAQFFRKVKKGKIKWF